MMRQNIFRIYLLWALIFTISFVHAQQFMMQGWYWDYPKTAAGKNWADSLNQKVQGLKDAGFTHLWLPPHTASASGQNSNGYDPKDLYIGNTTTGFATRPSLDALLNQMTSVGLKPVADMVMNHRDGGKAEDNPAVKSYITNYNWSKANNGDNPFPSDRFRCLLPLGGTSGNGAGDYYFKLRSASEHSRFYNKQYKLYMQTSKVGYQNLPALSESEPNGGGDCGEVNNVLPLGVDLFGNIDALGCHTDEFHVHLNAGDFNPAGDYLEIYMANPNGDYSDHRFYGIWSSSRAQDIVGDLIYQTYTDFSGMPSGLGEMHWDCFKPNFTNSTGLNGDQDGMFFFYDYDQNTTCARDALFAWAKWNCQTLGIKGFRLDAVKHFPASFVGDLLDYLHDEGIDLDLIVGEWYATNTGELAGWVNDVLNAMDADTKAAMQPKIFDFALRESLRQACDVYGYDARNIFTSSLNVAGLSGYHIVTFVNNHDFRDAVGFASLVNNDVMLPYAYILTNNQLGVPCVFYPDYYGYYGNAAGRSVPAPPLKPYMDQLIKVHQQYIYGASTAIYLTQVGSSYNTNFTSGGATTTVIYQMKGGIAGKDVVVAINFAGNDMNVDQEINTAGLSDGTIFTDVTGLSNGTEHITLSSGKLNLKLKSRSYAVWVQGENPKIPLPVHVISLDARKENKLVKINGRLTGLDATERIVLQKAIEPNNFGDMQTLDYTPGSADFAFSTEDITPAFYNYYRLKLMGKDDRVNYSEIKSVRFGMVTVKLVNTLAEAKLFLSGLDEKMHFFEVLNIDGKPVKSGWLGDATISVDSLLPGVYFLRLDRDSVYKFVKP